jgi:hypothetical protein
LKMRSSNKRRSLAGALGPSSLSLLIMLIITVSSMLIFTSATWLEAASPGDPSVSLSYFPLATDVGGPSVIVTYTASGFTPPLSQTWFINGVQAGTGSNLTISSNQAGSYIVSVKVTDLQGDSSVSSPVTIVVNPPPTANQLLVSYTPGASTATATLNVTGGTPPFSYDWSLNGKTTLTLNGKPESCSNSPTCSFDLPVQGVNNLTASATDSAGLSTAIEKAQIVYQTGGGGASLGALTYAGMGGGVAAVLLVLFLLRKKIFFRKGTTAVETHGEPRTPSISQIKGKDSGEQGEPKAPRAGTVKQQPKQVAKPSPPQPVIKIVKEMVEVQPAVADSTPVERSSVQTQPSPKPAQFSASGSPVQKSSVEVTASPARNSEVHPPATQQKVVSEPVKQIPPPAQQPLEVKPPGVTEVKAETAVRQETPSPTASAITTPVAQEVPKQIPMSMLRRDLNQDPADWILDCVGGYGFWSLEKGPLPKSELEKEFKKKYPNITIANFNSMVYDLIYKDKLVSGMVNGVMVLRLTKSVSEEKSAEWNRRIAEAKLLEAQLAATKQGGQPSQRRKEWIEIKPQTALGDGGPFDDLNARMQQAGWYGRILTTGAKELKSIMWHREPPLNESSPPKKYYPNIMIEWRQSGLGKGAAWHVEGVNISEDDFRVMIENKTWSEWLAKNKISVDFQTWEEAVVKVLEMGSTFVK